MRLRMSNYNSETAPELWFATSEPMFETNATADEKVKFSQILQCLNMGHLQRIRSIVTNSKDAIMPYTDVKKLLNFTLIAEKQPSRILDQIKILAHTAFSVNATVLYPYVGHAIHL